MLIVQQGLPRGEKASYIRDCQGSGEASRLLSLLWALVTREFKGRYRRTLLGPAWAIIMPLFYMVVFTFLRGVLDIGSDGLPYVIFTYSALVPWMFFANGVTRCGPSIVSNAGIVKKMAVAREVFPMAAIVAAFIEFVISAAILAALMGWFRVPVSWSLLWLPLLILLTALLALGLGLGVAALATFKRDIMYALPFVLQFWLLATPTMYPLSRVPAEWVFVYSLNPMVGIIEGFRTVLIRGFAPDVGLLALSMLGIAVVWLVTWPLFRYASQYFADVL